jgi:hypothetical protein
VLDQRLGISQGRLDSSEIAALTSELEATRGTDRPGFPIRLMVGTALAKSIYAVPTWIRLVALVTEHAALHATVTGSTPVPSVYACYRFTAKLRADVTAIARKGAAVCGQGRREDLETVASMRR